MRTPCPQFLDSNGKPLAGGKLFFYAAGTTNPQDTFTDATGSIANTNPVVLDGGGFPKAYLGANCGIWLSQNSYRVVAQNSVGIQQWVVDQVSDPGFFYTTKTVLLSPPGSAQQNISGPLGATGFVQTVLHVTSTGVRVSYLDPSTQLDTATNPPMLATTAPAASGHTYTIPDPGANANFVLSPNTTGNTLDCTQAGLTCKRTAFIYFDGGSCNNATPVLGFDTFGSNSPVPLCVTGTNVQKGITALPSAATFIQGANCTGAAATTCVVTIPSATTAADLLTTVCAVDGGKTVSSVSDGTNSYTKATSVANGNTDVEIWYFNGSSASVTASTSLTVTLSAGANSACRFEEHAGILTASLLDRTTTNTGTGTAVTSGSTAGTTQATEFVLAAVASPSTPSISGQTGWVPRTAVAQSTNVSLGAEGLVAQTIAAQAASFTLGSSQAWASAIATFKANVGAATVGQRSFALPTFFDTTRSIDGRMKWQAPLTPLGTVNVSLGEALACTTDGNTDDPTFNTAVTATPAVNTTSSSVITTTPFLSLTSTGCSASSLAHFQIQRNRYSTSDTYEGYVYVDGASLTLGITQ